MTQKHISTSRLLEVEERDQAGHVVTRYIASSNARGKRIDVSVPKNSNGWTKMISSAFLPAGYPQSVTEDYLKYRLYNSVQQFASSIAGLLASRAVLEGVGVGDANASPTAALLLSVLQDSMGRIATILFAHRLGTSLEPECKMYRLAADFLNDAAMILDCLSPAFPKTSRVVILSLSSILRALCGVTAGSSKASLCAHFTTQRNLGELNAKDSSQETIISLVGMFAGSLIVSYVTTPVATWSALMFLFIIHLSANYLAVRAITMRTLNRQRANIVFSCYVESAAPHHSFAAKYHQQVEKNSPEGAKTLRPQEVSCSERIFERDGVLRWNESTVMGYCILGVALKAILDTFPNVIRNNQTGSYVDFTIASGGESSRADITHISVENLLKLFAKEEYLLWFSSSHGGSAHPVFLIALKEDANTKTQLRAWFHAFLCARILQDYAGNAPWPIMDMLGKTLLTVNESWEDLERNLENAGWDTENGALETRSGTRLGLRSGLGGSEEESALKVIEL